MMDSVLVGAAQPVWMRAVMVQEGDDIVTRCCVVTDGDLFPIEVRVNIPRLFAAAQRLGLHTQAGQTQVGLFGFIKKAAKAVTKNKIVKAVGKVAKKTVSVTKSIVNNPYVQYGSAALLAAVPGGQAASAAIVTASLAAKAASPVLNVVHQAAKDVKKLTSSAPKKPSEALPVGLGALGFIKPQAATALGIGLKTGMIAQAAQKVAAAAKTAQQQVDNGKRAASVLNNPANKTRMSATQIAATKAVVQRAVNIQNGIKKLAPALAKQTVQSQKVKTQLQSIASAAKNGNVQAKLASRVLAPSINAISLVNKLQSEAAGGLPGLLVTSTGRIVRAPKGRFIQKTSVTAHPDVLYRGPKTPTLKGLFTAVSGCVGGDGLSVIDTEGVDFTDGYASIDGYEQHSSPGWGGDDDPGNDIDGPRTAVRYEEGFIIDRAAGAWTP